MGHWREWLSMKRRGESVPSSSSVFLCRHFAVNAGVPRSRVPERGRCLYLSNSHMGFVFVGSRVDPQQELSQHNVGRPWPSKARTMGPAVRASHLGARVGLNGLVLGGLDRGPHWPIRHFISELVLHFLRWSRRSRRGEWTQNTHLISF